jgi:hypothetical protein
MLKLGGRKFLLALICVAASVYLELTGHALSATMAGFLVSIVGLFAAANTAATKNHLQSKSNGNSDNHQILQKLNQMEQVIAAGFSPEAVQGLQNVLQTMDKGIEETRQIVRSMVKR